MLSKFLPWDFVSHYPTTIVENKPGIYLYYINNPYTQMIVGKNIPSKDIVFNVYSGNEVTRDLLETEFVNLSFFSNQNSLKVINGEQISENVLELFSEGKILANEKSLVIFFSKKTKLFTELSKLENVEAFEIEEARFWEGQKLWQFAQKSYHVTYSREVSHFILENLEHNLESFVWAINLIQLHFSERPVVLNELKELLTKQRWDTFDLMDLFYENPRTFFAELLKREDWDYEWFRSIFSFMQGHLQKVLNPEELAMKGKLNKYDQQILDLSKRINHKEMINYLRVFSELEIKSKASHLFIRDDIKLILLRM